MNGKMYARHSIDKRFGKNMGQIPISETLSLLGNCSSRSRCKKQRKSLSETFTLRIERLFQIYSTCASEDWTNSLEITKKNFLDRFIGNIYGKGLWKSLFEKRIMIAQHNKKIAGYAIVTRKRFLQKISDTATLLLFLPPQTSYEVGAHFMNDMLSNLAKTGVKTILAYSHAHDKDTMKQILTDLNMTPTTFMVPIREFDYVPNVGEM